MTTINPLDVATESTLFARLVETNPLASQIVPGTDKTMARVFARVSGNYILRTTLREDAQDMPITYQTVALSELLDGIEDLSERDLTKLENCRFDEDSLNRAFAQFVDGVHAAKAIAGEYKWSWTLGNRTTNATSTYTYDFNGGFHYLSGDHSDEWSSVSFFGDMAADMPKSA